MGQQDLGGQRGRRMWQDVVVPFSFKINYTPSVAVALHHSLNRSFTDALRRVRRNIKGIKSIGQQLVNGQGPQNYLMDLTCCDPVCQLSWFYFISNNWEFVSWPKIITFLFPPNDYPTKLITGLSGTLWK